MNILAIDTTTKSASVSLKYDDKITSNTINNEITHSEKLLPLIDSILASKNITLDDIQMLGCINGPGSFTGIRIGLSTIKAFAQVKNLPIFSMSSLELIAFHTFMKQFKNTQIKNINIVSLIDAKNDRVYFNLYNLSIINDKIKITENKSFKISNELIDDALSILNNHIDKNTIFAGDAITKFKNKITETFNVSDTNLYNIYPTTSDLIDAYENIVNIEDYMNTALTLDAVYARLSQAERVKNENG